MTSKRIGIIMHGVTGRMGTNQHLVRSILEIRRQGGVALKDGTRLMPDPILVGRDAAKLERLAQAHGLERWTSDLDQALANRDDTVFFDAASTQLRPQVRDARDRRRQTHLLREADRDHHRRGAGTLPSSAKGRRQARRRAGQAMAARVAEAEDAARERLFRAHALGTRRVRLLGIRGRLGNPPSAPPGTTARKKAAASSSTCCVIGVTCSTICSAK